MTAFESAFNTIQHLVKKFDEGFNHYMSAGYSEAEARQDFIDDFFIALGWDVSHKQQTNPYEQEVKIERSQKQQNESARKRADYAFFLNPNYKDEVFFVEAIKFILGLLNSNFIRLWFNTNFEAGLHIKINQLQKIPIVNINLKNPKQKSQHDSIVKCVTQLLAANQKLAQSKEGRDKDFLANQCNALDMQIDNLVYELYELTEDEIKIVEG